MEVSKWKEIWGKKSIDLKQKIILDDLIKADGFDNGVGSYDESSWRRLVADIQSRINVKATENVLEIGCGGGALLFALNEIVKAHYYGVDYSESLIQIAKRALPNGQFVISEAMSKSLILGRLMKLDVVSVSDHIIMWCCSQNYNAVKHQVA